MDCSRFNLLVIVMSCLAVLALPIIITGCGSSDDDDDENISNNVVTPDPEPIPEPTPQLEQQPAPEPPPGVSFQEDILPILQASCAVPGCHAAPNPPKGLNLETYAGFEKGGVFNPGDSKGSVVIQRIDGGGMPPGAPLGNDQIQLFKDWIDEGAKNN